MSVTKGKKSKFASIIICLGTVLPVIVYAFKNKEVDVYSQDTRQKNDTKDVCYTKKSVSAYPYLLSVMCSFIGTVIGVVLDHLTLMIDEHAHLATRYSRSWGRMTKACFNGVLYKHVTGVVTMAVVCVVVIIGVSDGHWSKDIFLTSILGGIGLEAKDVERVLTAVLSYFFNHLETDIEIFKRITTNHKRGKGQEELSDNKLLLLIPIDFLPENIDMLMSYDKQNISKVPKKRNPCKPFSVWHIKANNRVQRYYAVKYIKEPLVDLRQAHATDIDTTPLTPENCTQLAELLYKTLSGILENKYGNKNDKKVIPQLIPIRMDNNNTTDSLKDGNLMKCIMESIDPQESYNDKTYGLI